MEADSQGSQTVWRAMELVRLVSSSGRHGMRLNDIVESSAFSKPTAHRLLKELMACGMLMRSPDKRYFLGQFAYELGLSAAAHFHLREMCVGHLSRIAAETGDTVFMVVRSGPDSFCLDRQTGGYPIKVFSVEVGHRQPLGVGAGGLALLGWLGDAEIESVLARNAARLGQYGGLSTGKLRELADQARSQGYSRIADFAISGVSGVGMPVLDRVGTPILAVSVTSVSARMSPEHEAEVLAVLEREVGRMRQMLNNTAPALRK